MPELIEKFRQKCRHKPKQIVFTDSLDIHVLQTARYLSDEKLASPILLGTPSEIRSFAESEGIHTRGIRILHPLHMDNFNAMAKDLHELRQFKGMTRFEAEERLRNPLTMGAMLLRHQQADACIGGNIESTAQVLRTSIQILGVKDNQKYVSSYSLMISPDEEKIFAFADCLVIPRPTSEQMTEIAVTTAGNFEHLTGIEPRVAMLSFSTNKSADHELTQKVRQSVIEAKELKPSLILDGEVQFDAAADYSVARQKAPNCRLQGRANVFIFPSLNAGNIGYYIAKHLVGFKTIAPLLQGLNGNMHVIPKVCSTEDMINLALVASCL